MVRGISSLGALVLAIAALAIFSCGFAAIAQGPNQTAQNPPTWQFRLPDQEANLPAGEPHGEATVLLRIEGASLPQTPPEVRDLGYPAGYQVELLQVLPMSTEPNARNWLVRLKVRDFRTALGATRYLTVTQGGQSAILPYTMNNNYTAAFQWRLFSPAAAGMVWRPGMAIPVTVAIGGPVPATSVTLAQPMLIDPDSQEALSLQLCRNERGDCNPPNVLPAQQIHILYLRAPDDPAILAGNYQGSIVIAAAEKPDGDAIQMTLRVSSLLLKLLGVLAIAAGVAMSWLLTVVVRNALARKELERPLAQFEQRQGALDQLVRAVFPEAVGTVPVTVAALKRTAEDLARARTLLPPALPTPWQGQWAKRTEFETLVAQLDGRFNGLDVVGDGLVTAAKLPDSTKVRAAIADIDREAGTVGAKPLNEVKIAILAALAKAQEQQFDPADVEISSLERLEFQIALLSGGAWLVILSLTVMVGIMAVIAPDKGFGYWQDFIICLLWGIGIPIAGGQLTSTGADSVRNALSVTKPA